MANYLRQIVWLGAVLALGASAQTKPFSHQLHLKLKPDCASCHTAAAQSTSVADNLLPKPEACAGCHQNMAISLPPKVGIAKFSHKQHVPFGSVGQAIQASVKAGKYYGTVNYPEQLETKNACISCHRGILTSVAPTHDLIPQMQDCLSCHSNIELLVTCEQCHAKNQDLKPKTHTGDYMDIHTTARVAKDGCKACHAATFTCMGCHAR